MGSKFILVEKRPTGEEGKFVKMIIGIFTEDQADKAHVLSCAANRNLIKLPSNQLLEDGIIL